MARLWHHWPTTTRGITFILFLELIVGLAYLFTQGFH